MAEPARWPGRRLEIDHRRVPTSKGCPIRSIGLIAGRATEPGLTLGAQASPAFGSRNGAEKGFGPREARKDAKATKRRLGAPLRFRAFSWAFASFVVQT